MGIQQSNNTGTVIRDFLTNYLPQIRGMSSHTILSYRDSLKLLIKYLIEQKRISVSDLTIQNMGVNEVIDFLDHLEKNRGNGTGTRNIRLAAFHCFFRYLGGMYPEYLHQSQRVLSIPFKRTTNRTIDYIDFEEIMTILQTINRSTADGLRDYALLALMFNTGARVQEIVDLKTNDLQLSNPFSINIFGKGRKERRCPIWPETAKILRDYIENWGIDLREKAPVFLNHLGEPLTRFGIGYILKKYLQKAENIQQSLKKNAFILIVSDTAQPFIFSRQVLISALLLIGWGMLVSILPTGMSPWIWK